MALQIQHQLALSQEQAKLQDAMALQINSLERHLHEIQNSRSYKLSQFLSRRLNWVKKLFGLVK